MNLDFELKHTFRLLRKTPISTLLTLLTLSVGLGLTIFASSVLNTLLFKSLPFENSSGIVNITEAVSGRSEGRIVGETINAYDFYKLRNQISYITEIGAYRDYEDLVSIKNNSGQLRLANITETEWTLFEFTRTLPLLGRGFRREDSQFGADKVAVISFELWNNYFGKATDIIGREIEIGSVPTKVIGVMPENYGFPVNSEIWLPIDSNDLSPNNRQDVEDPDYNVKGYGRLAEDANISRTNTELRDVMLRIREPIRKNSDPLYEENFKVSKMEFYAYAASFPGTMMSNNLPILTAMFVIVALIYFLVCSNVSGLLVSRILSRTQEISVRSALGAPLAMLLFQVLLEGVIFCIVAGILALIFAGLSFEFVNQLAEIFYQQERPFWLIFGFDLTSIVIACAAVLISILITGLMPFYQLIKIDSNNSLHDGAKTSLGKGEGKLAQILVIFEVTISCIVLIVTTALISTSYNASNINYGVNTSNVLMAKIYFGNSNSSESPEKTANYYHQLYQQQKLNQSFVDSIYMSSPPGKNGFSIPFEAEGVEYQQASDRRYAQFNFITLPGSFSSIGIKLIDGRHLDENDKFYFRTSEANPNPLNPVMISESIAKTYWPSGSAVGKKLKWAHREGFAWMTIVGVVTDAKHDSALELEPVNLVVYMPRQGDEGFTVLMKFRGDLKQAQQELVQASAKVDPNVGIYDVRSYQGYIDSNTSLLSVTSLLLVACGIVAILLTMTGIYGVSLNTISRRRQEIGIRRAIGAKDGQVISYFMLENLWQLILALAVGLSIGLYLSIKIGEVIAIDISDLYSSVFIVPASILILVMLSIFIPVRKSLQQEPAESLRCE